MKVIQDAIDFLKTEYCGHVGKVNKLIEGLEELRDKLIAEPELTEFGMQYINPDGEVEVDY